MAGLNAALGIMLALIFTIAILGCVVVIAAAVMLGGRRRTDLDEEYPED